MNNFQPIKVPITDHLSLALEDFRRARNKAILKGILSRFTGESIELLSYEEVRQKLKAIGSAERGLQEIPLDAIVGSVGRYADFTRDFLPKQDVIQDRWAKVKLATENLIGLPPIEVYKIGEVYFVKDGNHRVSVARQLGAKTIQAYVTEVRTRVSLTPDIQPDELILKAEYAEFLEHTHLDELRPEADLNVTVPGKYPMLEEHIAVHRYYMGLEQRREIPWEEAVAHWYDTVYLPVVQAIRDGGILRYFPNRTEADLYLWIAEHRAALEKEWGVEIKTEVAALDLVKQTVATSIPGIARLGEKVLDALSLGILDEGPPAGQWRKEVQVIHKDDRLFTDILVPVNGEESGWYALDQALIIAKRENSRLHGLHVVDTEEEKNSEMAQFIQDRFVQRCKEQEVEGHLIVTTGEVAHQISLQSRLTDLVVTTLLYPPPPQILARLDSGFRELIRHCPRPILAVPQVVTPLSRALLAYDGSPKADEALFVATYLAGRWGISLSVVTVFENGSIAPETLMRARLYLEEHNVQAETIGHSGRAAEAIINIANEKNIDLIIIGGYGRSPLLEVVLGSTVDQVLREARRPILICR